FNEDGNLDILVSNYRLQPNSLWIGSSEGTFQAGEVQKRIEVSTGPQHGHTIGSAWGDLDNDGHLDLFVGNFSHPRAGQDPPLFLKNLGPAEGFRFSDRTEAAALNWQESYASPVLGDFDNDGLLDLFLTAVYRNDHSVLYRNLGDWRFQDLTEDSGIRTAETYQAACADFDNDGDLDLVSGGRLWRNELGDSNWLRVRLDGRTGGSRSAFGARITLRYGPKIQVRQIESATGEGNQSEETAHFGLGSFEGEVTLEIQWPDGSLQWISSPVNRLLLVRRSVHVRSQAKGDHWRGRSSGQ
ncbi:MAG: CRTAC1 family protein, partial [Acidobacteriota bacterium]